MKASRRAAPFRERQGAQIFGAIEQQVIEAHVRRVVSEHAPRDGLAIEPLLQIVEGRHLAVAQHQHSPSVTQIVARKGLTISGKAGEMSSPWRREDAHATAPRGDLHADAVPLPLCEKIVRDQVRPVLVLDRIGEHHGPE